MSLSNSVTILEKLTGHDGEPNLRVVEQTLSDRSRVYDLWIGTYQHPCLSKQEADRAADTILGLIFGGRRP